MKDAKFIFETENLIVRYLTMSDLYSFHVLQSSKNVMKYVTGKVRDLTENKKDLEKLIDIYTQESANFLIYAIILKKTNDFVGTCAFVKDEFNDDEIGYRFIEKYWGLGFGYEVCKGLISYCKSIGFKKLVAYVVDENVASKRILEKCDFNFVCKGIEPKLRLPESKYKLVL